jgi:predicted TIM-barrel fold metal-dependent hydrolase
MVSAPANTMIVDCDTHFWGPDEPWVAHLDVAKRDAVVEAVAGATFTLPAIAQQGVAANLANPNPGGLDPAARLEWMDEEGIFANIIFPTNAGASTTFIADRELARLACRAVNRWSAEFAAAAPARLKPCMVVPMREPEDALAELKYASGTLGLEVVFAAPIPMGRCWSDPTYDPLWQAIQDRELTLTFHEFSRAAEGSVARPFYRQSYPMMYLCGHVVEIQLTAMDLILGGVLERFPRLKVGFIESHIAWVPGWLALMDDSFPRTSTFFRETTGKGPLSLRPSDFFRRQMFVAAFPDDVWLPEVVKYVGAETLVACTDYPHPQTRYNLVRQLTDHQPDLSEPVRRQILGENAARIFRLEQ